MEALTRTINQLAPAIFWTGATTAVGFAALLSSTISPVRSFGIMMSLATMLVLVAALALGADAVSIGTAALVALGDNDPALEDEYQKMGTTAGAYDDWHEGNDPAGITTQRP